MHHDSSASLLKWTWYKTWKIIMRWITQTILSINCYNSWNFLLTKLLWITTKKFLLLSPSLRKHFEEFVLTLGSSLYSIFPSSLHTMYAYEIKSTVVTVSRCFFTNMLIWYYVLTLRHTLKLEQEWMKTWMRMVVVVANAYDVLSYHPHVQVLLHVHI